MNSKVNQFYFERKEGKSSVLKRECRILRGGGGGEEPRKVIQVKVQTILTKWIPLAFAKLILQMFFIAGI